MKYFTSRAISLLESMLVIVLAAVIVLVAARQYTKFTEEKNIRTLNNSVQLLLVALKSYYLDSSNPDGCQKIYSLYQQAPQGTDWQTSWNPSIESLVDGGYLENSAQLRNPFFQGAQNKAFRLTVNSKSFPFTIAVHAYFDNKMSSQQAQAIAAKINPTSMSMNNHEWTWKIMPSRSTAYTGDAMNTLETSLENYALKQTTLQEANKMGSEIQGNVPCSVIERYLYEQSQP